MSDILIRIKRAVLAGHYAFSEKARLEMECDGLSELPYKTPGDATLRSEGDASLQIVEGSAREASSPLSRGWRLAIEPVP